MVELFDGFEALLKCLPPFPDLSEELTFFETTFDHEQARREGRIVPEPGLDEQYDSAVQGIKRTAAALQSYLSQQCRLLGCRVVFWGSGRNRYQGPI